ncbi:hypothetical protein pb186bvf_016688 [Paramecium bursaria]
MNLFTLVPISIELDKKLVTDPKDIIKQMTYLGISEQQSLILLLIEQLIVNGLYEKLLHILRRAAQNPLNQKIIDEIQINKRMTLSRFEQLQKDQKQNGLQNLYKYIMDQKFGKQVQIGASQIIKYFVEEFGINIQILDDNAITYQSQIKLNGTNDAILYITNKQYFAIRLPQSQQSQLQSQSQQSLQSQSQSQSSSKLYQQPSQQSQIQSQSSPKLQIQPQQQIQQSSSIIQQKNNCTQCYYQGKQFYFDEQQYLKYLNLQKYQSGIEQFECYYCKSKFNKNDIQDYIKTYERHKSQQQSSINQKNQSNIMCQNCLVIQENQNSLINNICTKCLKSQQDKSLNSQTSQLVKSKTNYYGQKDIQQDKEVVCNLCQKYCNPNTVFKLSCGHIYCFLCGEQITKLPFFKCRQSTCSSQFEQNTLIKFLDKHKQANKIQAQEWNLKFYNQSNIYDNNSQSMIQSKTLSSQQQSAQPNYMPSAIQSKKDTKIYNNSKNCQMCGEDFSNNNIQIQMKCYYNHVIGICCFLSEYQDCIICEIKNPYQIYRFEYQPFQKQKLYYLSNPNEGRQPNRYQNPQVQDDQKVIPYRENVAVIRIPQQVRTTSQPNQRQ